ncbi:M23 family metallopeptidase [Plantactinospora sp. B5E13]|uniref:M23 family metallopeptidase n=1 Tax=unclassified Plantactinospora TaxID=2631981 RepID=UPI00325DA200
MAALTRRPRRAVLAFGLTAVLALLCCAGGTTAFLLTMQAAEEGNPYTLALGCGTEGHITLDGEMPLVSPYDAHQMRNAAIIINVGKDRDLPPRAWVIAVATALQESTLHNYGYLGSKNDHDSLGLFQQRPSMGWGSPKQVQDPVYASTKFYEKLEKVPDWQNLPLTVAAQRVQISGYPDAYAKHEATATQIVNVLTGGAGLADGASVDLSCADGADIAASGWTAPIPGTVGSGFRTAARPSHHGVDIGAGYRTEIRAAAAGKVVVSTCDPDNRGRLSCDAEGWPGKGGCGWFVDILHAGDVVTRYCHMIRKPMVGKNDEVRAGQVIGLVGSSGNSSGPHLHFEVHLNRDRTSKGATDPVPFMKARGAPFTADG